FFNPAGYRSRVENYTVFAEGLARQGANLLTVELAFGDDPFQLPPGAGALRLRGQSVLWQKERLINYALSRLPPDCTAFTWLDCDVLFGEDRWVERLAELLPSHDVVQLFEKVIHLPPGQTRYRGEDRGVDVGIARQAQGNPEWLSLRRAGKLPFAVTGFAWAARRDALVNGLY